jgi:hypothetical protein
MDEAVEAQKHRPPLTFNSPVEAGVRAIALLTAAYPSSFDLRRLVAFDHLLVHTGAVEDGPESLHPDVPLQRGEFLVRRRLVERGLLLMMTRELVRRQVAPDGFRYIAGESAVPFLSAIASRYVADLQDRARWLVQNFGSLREGEFRTFLQQYFDRWVAEFQNTELSSGAEA